MYEVHIHPTPEDCQGALHPMAARGCELFNQGEYWKAHEALEAAWLEERCAARHLYRGILQVAVTYYHIRRANYAGAMKVYARSLRWLAPFPPVCRGVDVARLRQDLESAIEAVRRLGAERLAEFDPTWLRPIHWKGDAHE